MESKKPSLALAYNVQKRSGKGMKMVQGGVVRATSEADEHYESIADAILSKKRMAKGGEVAAHGQLDNEESGQSPYDNYNSDAFGDSYDDDQLSAQPMDGDQHGDADEKPKAPGEMKLVDRIRERMKTRRGF